MEILSRTITHVPATAGPWLIVEPVSLGAMRLPISPLFSRTRVIAWLIESYCYDRGDASTHTETMVDPVGPFGQPRGPWLLQAPSGTLLEPDGFEVDDAFEYFTKALTGT